MGMKAPSNGLAAALFSPVQRRVLGLLFGQPERRFQSAELIRLVNSGTGAVHRVLTRLSDAGLVTVTRIGNQKHYQANNANPVFAEIHGLAVKSMGAATGMDMPKPRAPGRPEGHARRQSVTR